MQKYLNRENNDKCDIRQNDGARCVIVKQNTLFPNDAPFGDIILPAQEAGKTNEQICSGVASLILSSEVLNVEKYYTILCNKRQTN